MIRAVEALLLVMVVIQLQVVLLEEVVAMLETPT